MQPRKLIPVRRAAAAIVLALSLAACATWEVQTAPVDEVLQSRSAEVIQVRRKDGSKQTLISPYVDGSAIVGFQRVAEPAEGAVLHQRQYQSRFDTLTVPIAEVDAVAVRRSAPVRTALFVATAFAGVATVLGSAGAN